MGDWLTIAAITEEFGVSDRTIRRAVKRSELHPAQASRAPNAKMRFHRAEVEQWLTPQPQEA